MRATRRLVVFPSLLFLGATAALAQGQALPTSQPQLLTIIREQVKPGRGAEHQRIEAGWPAAFAKAKSPVYYLAMTSLTGANEAWFVVPFASNAAAADEMKLESSDTTLAAELGRLGRADAEVITDSRTIQAVARPELSHGNFPDLAKMRFWQITIFRVRPGDDADFVAAAKAYGAATDRSASGANYRIYQVTAGMPEPTYLIFESVGAYADFDALTAGGQKTMQSFTPDEQTAMQKFTTDAMINSESNRFVLNPTMSYVSAETRATDVAFWTPKRPARRQ